MTNAQQLPTIAIEAMQVGHRYLNVVAGYEHGWIVASVDRRASDLQVRRNGQWVHTDLVTVTYNNGQTITDEVGTEIAIDCDAA